MSGGRWRVGASLELFEVTVAQNSWRFCRDSGVAGLAAVRLVRAFLSIARQPLVSERGSSRDV